MSPTPNTTFFRAAARGGHFRHSLARARNSAMAASLVWRSGGATASEVGIVATATAGSGVALSDSTTVRTGAEAVAARVGAAMVELGSRTHGEFSAANVSWDTGMNLT